MLSSTRPIESKRGDPQLNSDLPTDSPKNRNIPFYQPTSLKELDQKKELALNSDGDAKVLKLSMENRIKVEAKAEFQRVIDKHRKRIENEDKIKRKKEEMKRKRRQEA